MICGINGCPRTYGNYYSYRKHILRKHRDFGLTSLSDVSLQTLTDNGMSENGELLIQREEENAEDELPLNNDHDRELLKMCLVHFKEQGSTKHITTSFE